MNYSEGAELQITVLKLPDNSTTTSSKALSFHFLIFLDSLGAIDEKINKLIAKLIIKNILFYEYTFTIAITRKCLASQV